MQHYTIFSYNHNPNHIIVSSQSKKKACFIPRPSLTPNINNLNNAIATTSDCSSNYSKQSAGSTLSLTTANLAAFTIQLNEKCNNNNDNNNNDTNSQTSSNHFTLIKGLQGKKKKRSFCRGRSLSILITCMTIILALCVLACIYIVNERAKHALRWT